jgi:hypothetical protein
MIRYALLAAGVSLALASAGSAAPLSPSPQLKQAATSDLVQVKKWKGKNYKGKNWNKHYKHKHYKHWNNWDHRYRYGGRYWGHRYSYRPYYWRSWGCIKAGPVWYCP